MSRGLSVALWAAVAFCAATALLAHELRPGYLEISELDGGLVRVVWKKPTSAEVALDIQPRLPESWKEVGTSRVTRTPDALVLTGVYDPGGKLAGQRISIVGLSATATDVLVRVVFRDQTTLTRILKPESPGFTIAGGAAAGAGEYLGLGIKHILLGVDHLLFVLGLLVIVGRR